MKPIVPHGDTLSLLAHNLLQNLAKDSHLAGVSYQLALIYLRQLLAKTESEAYGLTAWHSSREAEDAFIENLFKSTGESPELPEDIPETLH